MATETAPTLSRKENAMTLAPIVASPATETGAIAGFESSCSCGLVLRNAFEGELRLQLALHADWHAEEGR